MKEIGFHKNVLPMLGFWVKSEPIYLIVEYLPHGDLLQWLRSQRSQVRQGVPWQPDLLEISSSCCWYEIGKESGYANLSS